MTIQHGRTPQLRFSQSIVGLQDYASGIRYMSVVPSLLTTAASTTNSTGTLYFQPFLCTFTHTFTGISFVNGNSMNGKKARMGIYTSSGRQPAALLVDAGEITVSDTNVNTVREIAISQQLLQDNLYWLAWTCDTNSADVLAVATMGSVEHAAELGIDFTAVSTDRFRPAWFKMSHAYAALPSPSSLTTANLVSGIPVMSLKG